MGIVKKILKKVPGVTLAANKARALVRPYEYRKALTRIKITKEMIIERHAKQADRKIVVAFIVQYVPAWNKLKPIYDRLNIDNDFVTLLLCVPSVFNESRVVDTQISENTNDTFEYLKNQGYHCINAFDGEKWFDLKKCEPDYVFHSRPYNHFMPKQYISSEISKYALICNVLYSTFSTQEIVNTTLNFDFFKDVYCYFSFDQNDKNSYEEKFKFGIDKCVQQCYIYGGTGLEQILLSKCEKEKNKFKKTVLWTPRWSTDPIIGGSNFFRYKNVIMGLIERYPDVKFIIRPHPLMFGNFIKTGEMTKEEVSDFKKYCFETDNVCLDEKKEYIKTFWQSDFIIADPSGIVAEYYITNKPIIYCAPKTEFIYSEYLLQVFRNSYVVKESYELVDFFEMLYKDNDYKKTERSKSFNVIFGDFENSSKNIRRFLYSEVKRQK